jgi:ADP-ribose pyrophosphatase
MRKNKLEELKRTIDELTTIKKIINENPKKKFITSKSYLFTLNNGRTIPREQLLKNGLDGSAVMIAPLIENEFLMTIEPRVFTKQGVAVSFPAGYIEKDETPLEAAKRELREETGCLSDNFIYLDSYYQDEGVSKAFNHSFLALDVERVYEQDLDENEIIKYMTFTYPELLEIEKMGYLSGSNTKLTLCKIKDYL